MNTYNIKVKGIEIIKEIKLEDLEQKLTMVKGFLTLTGKEGIPIEVVLNKNNPPCKY
jgi:hypothetical protein